MTSFPGDTTGVGKIILKTHNRFIWLDFIRGCCAIAVCASHLRAVAIVDYASLGPTSLFQKLFFFSTGLGHQSVMIFFVLSGFFVGGGVLRHRESFDPLRYSIARLTRLWIVLIPALIATVVVDVMLKEFAPDVLTGHYKTLWNSGPGVDGHYSASVATFIANVFFLQTVTSPVFGANGPLWSLSNEFWYYVLFPLALMSIQGVVRSTRISGLTRLCLGFIALAIAIWLPRSITEALFIWALGLIVFATLEKLTRLQTIASLLLGTVFVVAALGYSKSDAMQHSLGISSDFVLGTAFAVLAIGIVNRHSDKLSSQIFGKFAKLLSDFSYSLYLIHFPFVVLIGGFFYRESKLLPDARGVVYFSMWLVLLLACGYGFYLMFERRTDELRRRVERLLRDRRA